MDTQSKEIRIITMNIGRELYGIDIFTIDSIIRTVKITPVPLVNRAFLGVINVRGTVISVISLRRILGFEDTTASEDNRILILRTENKELIGVMADSVNDVLTVGDDYTENLSENIRNRAFISGVVKNSEGLISVLNINTILGSLLNEVNNG